METQRPTSEPDPEQGGAGSFPFPRWALYVLLPGLLGPIVIFGFIVVTEVAHDSEDCPFALVVEREVAPRATVVEERRRCLPSVEERRFSLIRGGGRRVLGERRFEPAAFGDGYRWTAELSEQGEVRVVVENPGHEDVLFREGTAEERAKNTSL